MPLPILHSQSPGVAIDSCLLRELLLGLIEIQESMIEVSRSEAKSFILHVQGLRTQKPASNIMSVMNRIHNVQIDTISVVSRSHNLIIYNRLPVYKEGSVWSLLKQRKIFEYWSHAACLMPMETYPFYAWRSSFFPEELWSSFRKWASKNHDAIEEVYARVKKDGVTNSASMGERKAKSDGWWDWKTEKRALEYLYITGKLMIAYRKNFQKYYDLAERVLPPGISTEPISEEEAREFVLDTTLRSLGLGSYLDVRSYLGAFPARRLWGRRKEQLESYLDHQAAEGRIEEVSIE